MTLSDGSRLNDHERQSTLRDLEDWLQTPMLILSFLWLALVLAGFIWGETGLITVFGTVIWVIFIAEFLLRLSLAPAKLAFLRANWLTVIALIVPAFRMLRVIRALRAARAVRGIRLVRIVGSANRGMGAIRAAMRRRGIGYVVALTVLVALLGAGGMLAFEPAAEQQGGFVDYGDALWWTAMLLTTIGSAYWPQTAEGRVLCFLLSLYGLGVFGYITATIASLFIGIDAASASGQAAGDGEK